MKVLASIKYKRHIFVVTAVLAVAVISSVYFVFPSDNANASKLNPIADITMPSTTSTTLPIPQLPQPQDSPADPYEKVPVNSIGSIEIPKIGLNHTLYEGVWLTVLNVGPGHWPGTAEPGEYGNTVIAGHRVTHSKPFRKIDELADGDEIIVNTSTGRHVYKVTGREIVFPKDIWIVDQTPGYRITLFACHPPGSAKQRYVIYGDLVDPPTKVPANV